MKFTAAACVLGTIALAAQAPQDRPIFREEANYIEVDALVTDRDGAFVRGLTKEDFELLEDGRPQTIADLRLIDLQIEPRASREEPSVEPDVVTNAAQRRVYVLLLEPLFQEGLAAMRRAQQVAHRFVDEALGPGDMMAVIHVQGSMSHAQAFTGRKSLLHSSIDLLPQSVLLNGGESQCDLPRLRNTYEALEEVDVRLGTISGRRKAIIWIGGRIPFDPSAECEGNAGSIAFMHRDAIRAATRNNVGIYPVDPRGLSPYMGISRMLGALRGVAEDTGGQAVVNTNGFSRAFEQIVRDNSAYYLLGYEPATVWRDGRFHTITVRVKRPGVTVRARRGYYAPEPGSVDPPPVALADGLSREASRALRSSLPTSGLTMHAIATPFKGAGRNGSVVIGAQLRGADLRLDAQDQIEVSYLTIDTDGHVVPGQRQVFTLHLRDESRAAVRAAGFRYLERLDLPKGRHEIRLTVHQPGGATGAVVMHVEVPDYTAGPLHMSGVALASRAAAADRTLKGDAPLRAVLSANPTAQRQFARGDTVTAYVEVYADARTSPADVRLTATITRARGSRVRTLAVTRGRDEPGQIAFTTTFPLADLAPGDYVLTLEARAGRRSATRQVPFAVVEE